METLLSSAEVAELLKVSAATLSRWRAARTGPIWVDLHGIPRYRPTDVAAFIQDCAHDSF